MRCGMKRINVYLADGFEEIEAVTIIDVLRRGEIKVFTVSVKESLMVKGAHGIEIKADINIKSMEADLDGHILPGGPGAEILFKSEELKKVFMEANEGEKLLGAICAAPSVLGRWGLLKGKKATAYPGNEKYLVGADIRADAVVTDGNIFTSRGPGTAMEFGLSLVEELSGKTKMQQVKARLLYNK